VLILCCALLAAVSQKERGEAFWLGFSVFGWTYFILSFVFFRDSEANVDFHRKDRVCLITTLAIDWLYGVDRFYYFKTSQDVHVFNRNDPSLAHFLQVGHAFFALLFAFLGGSIGRMLFLHQQAREDAEKRQGPGRA
jgi:hypothetical protein